MAITWICLTLTFLSLTFTETLSKPTSSAEHNHDRNDFRINEVDRYLQYHATDDAQSDFRVLRSITDSNKNGYSKTSERAALDDKISWTEEYGKFNHNLDAQLKLEKPNDACSMDKTVNLLYLN